MSTAAPGLKPLSRRDAAAEIARSLAATGVPSGCMCHGIFPPCGYCKAMTRAYRWAIKLLNRVRLSSTDASEKRG